MGQQRSRGISLARGVSAPNRCDPGAVRRDCVGGHVGLELRNVVANYPFERSLRFPGIQPNSGDRDDSRLSCSVGHTQLPGSQQGVLPRTLVIELCIAEMARIAGIQG
jgi:hypothetical protein